MLAALCKNGYNTRNSASVVDKRAAPEAWLEIMAVMAAFFCFFVGMDGIWEVNRWWIEHGRDRDALRNGTMEALNLHYCASDPTWIVLYFTIN